MKKEYKAPQLEVNDGRMFYDVCGTVTGSDGGGGTGEGEEDMSKQRSEPKTGDNGWGNLW